MLEKLLDILKAVGTYRAGFAFVAGIAFCFLGFFDIGDFKSITIRTQSVLPPVIVGSFLITVGLALHLMPKGRQRVPATFKPLRICTVFVQYKQSSATTFEAAEIRHPITLSEHILEA